MSQPTDWQEAMESTIYERIDREMAEVDDNLAVMPNHPAELKRSLRTTWRNRIYDRQALAEYKAQADAAVARAVAAEERVTELETTLRTILRLTQAQ